MDGEPRDAGWCSQDHTLCVSRNVDLLRPAWSPAFAMMSRHFGTSYASHASGAASTSKSPRSITQIGRSLACVILLLTWIRRPAQQTWASRSLFSIPSRRQMKALSIVVVFANGILDIYQLREASRISRGVTLRTRSWMRFPAMPIQCPVMRLGRFASADPLRKGIGGPSGCRFINLRQLIGTQHSSIG